DGASTDIIHDYLRSETYSQQVKFDENFMGFYAVIDDVFMSGIDWIAPDDYNPYERDWYKAAVKADGDVAIVEPYLDAQSGDIIISFAKLLSDKKNSVSLDVSLNHIQETVEEININGNGYGMVIDKNGDIIAHKDATLNGQNCSDVFEDDAFLNAVLTTRNGRTEAVIDGYKYTIFVNEVLNQWYTVVLVKNMELFSETKVQLIVNVGVYLIIFFLITFFYYMSYMNEQSANQMMEELVISKQKQEYEAKVLKLEKSAADDANKAKSRFLADMSHEIRTPINAVLGMNEMILRETESESIKEYSENIRSSGRALLSLINSILDFSKIEDGKMEIVPVDYSVVDMIHYLQNSIAERAAAKSLALIVDVDPSIPKTLHGDDMRISQVIMNLLTNAVKYTKTGEVRLTVKNSGITDKDLLLYVEVKDTGIGIKEEDMPKLFESFERLDKEKNRNIEGTGLGMSIVTRLLSMMDSSLSATSKYGEGSTFSFVIKQGIVDETPIDDTFIKLTEGSTAKRENTYHESFTSPNGRILIVDDTKMNLNVAKNLLKKTLLNIETALSGDEALTLCASKKYDVILMDQRMPGLDGTQTLHLIREQFEGYNIDTPVICLTADAISGARDRYLAEGFSDYLTKPIDGGELEKLLLKYLPEDKIEKGENQITFNLESDRTSTEENSFIDRIKALGIDTDTGLSFCRNDADMYKNVLLEYIKEMPERTDKLKNCFENSDWKNYAVYVHSLKSTSKMIGATNLSEKALKLEEAANREDSDFIKENHADASDGYRNLASKMADIFGIDLSANDTEDIMEFLPQ
ncbi:MAG: response regulator, partial [Lachnospiraceae bacterium]|nr:response regulator [Lachnospiraceae bacterium]